MDAVSFLSGFSVRRRRTEQRAMRAVVRGTTRTATEQVIWGTRVGSYRRTEHFHRASSTPASYSRESSLRTSLRALCTVFRCFAARAADFSARLRRCKCASCAQRHIFRDILLPVQRSVAAVGRCSTRNLTDTERRTLHGNGRTSKLFCTRCSRARAGVFWRRRSRVAFTAH